MKINLTVFGLGSCRMSVIGLFWAFFMFLSISGCASSAYYINKNYNTAEKLYERSRYEDAKKYYKQYLANNPESVLTEVVLYHMGRCYQETGDTGEARTIYEQLLDEHKEGYWVQQAKKRIDTLK